MDNKSDTKVGATMVSTPKNAKREGEDEDEKQVSAKKQKRDEVAEEQKNKEEISLDDASTDSEQDKTPDVKKGCLSTQEKKGQPATCAGSSKSSDDGSNEDEGEMDIDEVGSSEESDEEAQKKRMKAVDTYSDRSDDDNDNDNDGDDDDIENPYMIKKPVKVSESSEYSEEELGKKASKTYQESLKTTATLKQQNTASKTIYVGNLSYSVERADMENLFKECGEIVDVRLHTDQEGRFKGFGHVEFAIADAAQKALELDNTELLRRPIKVVIAQARGEYTRNRSNLSNSLLHMGERAQPQTVFVKGFERSLVEEKIKASLEERFGSCGEITRISIPKFRDSGPVRGNLSNSLFHKGERAQPQTVFVKGFDRSLAEEKIKASLVEHFGSCGEITRISIPTFRDSGFVRGFAHLEFKDDDCMNKALQLHQTKLGGYPLLVQIAKPLHHNQGIGSGRDGGSHQFVGRYGGGYGGSVGWSSSGDSWRH